MKRLINQLTKKYEENPLIKIFGIAIIVLIIIGKFISIDLAFGLGGIFLILNIFAFLSPDNTLTEIKSLVENEKQASEAKLNIASQAPRLSSDSTLEFPLMKISSDTYHGGITDFIADFFRAFLLMMFPCVIILMTLSAIGINLDIPVFFILPTSFLFAIGLALMVKFDNRRKIVLSKSHIEIRHPLKVVKVNWDKLSKIKISKLHVIQRASGITQDTYFNGKFLVYCNSWGPNEEIFYLNIEDTYRFLREVEMIKEEMDGKFNIIKENL